MPTATDISDEVRKKLAEATRRQVAILARELVATFVIGYRKAGATAPLSDLQRNAIAAYTKEQTGYIAEMNQAIGDLIAGKIKEAIGKGMTYDQIKQNIKPYIKEVFTTGTVEINRVGQTRDIVKVDRDGNLYRVTKTITKPYSTSVENYSDMLSRTTTHGAYSRGRIDGYAAQGMSKYRWVSAQDERVRSEHLALHGRVFEIGSDEDYMAQSVAEEPNCRCRQIPFFDDPEMDTPQEVYDKQKEEQGLVWQDDAWVIAPT